MWTGSARSLPVRTDTQSELSPRMNERMDITRAVQLVANDQKDMDDIHTVADAIERALDTLRLPEDLPVPGAWPIEGDDELAEAYKTVLRHEGPGNSLRARAQAIAEHAGAQFIAEYESGRA